MINWKKIINISLSTSNNIFEDILLPLEKRQGFIQKPVPYIPIYFYRYIGIKENEEEYYNDLYKLDQRLSNLGSLYIKFTNGLPVLINNEILNKTKNIWHNMNDFDNSKKDFLVNYIINHNVLPKTTDTLLNDSIIEAFKEIIDLYLIREQNINLTKIKNFLLKFLAWINKYVPNLLNNFNYTSSKNQINNPKVLFYGNIKRHEVYFLIFLSKIGCDILYINSFSEGEFVLIDRNETYSKIIRLSKKSSLKEFPKIENSPKQYITANKSLINSPLNNIKIERKSKPENIINISLKTSHNLFQDILSPLNERSGFIGYPMPIIPIYFYRYIGIKEKEENYYNELFRLDKKLSNFENLYIKFIDKIPVIANNELINNTGGIWKTISTFNKSHVDTLVYLLKQSNTFPQTKDSLLNNSIIENFRFILDLYLKNEKNLNVTKVKNFCLKLLGWIQEFVPKLFNNFEYSNKQKKDIINPKVLYYGDIKNHEVYFLILLSKLGSDIIYINSYSESEFVSIDKEYIHSKVIMLPKKSVLKEFPKSEVLVRQETEAFKASKEISNIIYNEQDGLYKPWQFESYNIQPITLKTTYDELKLLWNEESRMRSGFKIENNTVYIPNLFAKVSGIYKDKNQYWNEFIEFKSSENTFFIPSIPFTDKTYSNADLYFSRNLFNNEGLINKDNLLKSNLYKFSYLKTPLQNTIINKINNLFRLPIFNRPIDLEFKLKILLTILKLDKKLLNLIQLFDYPFKIPKLLIYDNNENIFSDEDSIIIAFLYLMGFDILIFTPTGYNNIEQKLSEQYYDIHKLESVDFDLPLPDFNTINKNKRKSFLADFFRF